MPHSNTYLRIICFLLQVNTSKIIKEKLSPLKWHDFAFMKSATVRKKKSSKNESFRCKWNAILSFHFRVFFDFSMQESDDVFFGGWRQIPYSHKTHPLSKRQPLFKIQTSYHLMIWSTILSNYVWSQSLKYYEWILHT